MSIEKLGTMITFGSPSRRRMFETRRPTAEHNENAVIDCGGIRRRICMWLFQFLFSARIYVYFMHNPYDNRERERERQTRAISLSYLAHASLLRVKSRRNRAQREIFEENFLPPFSPAILRCLRFSALSTVYARGTFRGRF